MSIAPENTHNGLPTELIEKIVDDLDHPSDLLHLALASKDLCSLVLPTHLESREILYRLESDDAADAFWTQLLRRPLAAFRARSLCVLPKVEVEGAPAIHELDVEDSSPAHERLAVVRALEVMSNLHELSWQAHHDSFTPVLNILPTLTNALTRFSVSMPPTNHDLWFEKISSLSGLTHLELGSSQRVEAPAESGAFLDNFPLLESLWITSNWNFNTRHMLQISHWPNLTTLIVESMTFEDLVSRTTFAEFPRFLPRHPRLKHIHTSPLFFNLPLNLWPSGLRTMDGVWLGEGAPRGKLGEWMCSSAASELKYFGYHVERPEQWELLPSLGALRGLQLFCKALPSHDLGVTLPRLQRLEIPYLKTLNEETEQFLQTSVPNVTHLYAYGTFIEDENDTKIARLAEILPRLRYTFRKTSLTVNLPGQRRVYKLAYFEIFRDGEGRFLRCDPVQDGKRLCLRQWARAYGAGS